MSAFDPSAIESTMPDATWDAIAEWLRGQPDYAPVDHCPYCEFVGSAYGLTDGARLEHAREAWPLLARSPFADQLRAWAPPGALP